MYYLNTINFKRKVNINRDNIYINIYNIPLIYIKESAINSQHAAILSNMYMHTFTCVCKSQRRFFSLLSLKYITYSFLSPFLPAVCPVVSCSVSPWLVLLSCAWLPYALSPFIPIRRAPEALSAFCVLPCVVMLPAFSVCRVSSGGCRHSSSVRRKTA